jgi:hypothetical protein
VPRPSAIQIAMSMPKIGTSPSRTEPIAATSSEGSSTQKISFSMPAQIASSRSRRRFSTAPSASMPKQGTKASM